MEEGNAAVYRMIHRAYTPVLKQSRCVLGQKKQPYRIECNGQTGQQDSLFAQGKGYEAKRADYACMVIRRESQRLLCANKRFQATYS